MIGPGRGNPRGCPGFAVAHKGDRKGIMGIRKGIMGDRKGIMGNRKGCRPYTKSFSFSKKKN